MKKSIVLVVLGLFLVSLVPVVAEEDSNSGDSDTDTASDTDVALEVDTKVRSGRGSRDRSDIVRAEIKTRLNETITARVEERTERIEKRADAQKEKSTEIRERQRARIEVAIAACDERDTSEVAACKERLEERLVKVDALAEKDIERIEKIREHRLEQVGKFEKLLEKKVYAKFRDGKARKLSEESLESARGRFKAARESFLEAKEHFAEEKKLFAELKLKVKLCKDKTDEECKKVRGDITIRAKGLTNETLTMMVEHLEKVKASVQESEHITDAEAVATVAALDARIEKVLELQAKVAAITAETPKEEVQKLAKEVAAAWKTDVKADAEHHAGFVMASRMGGVVVRSEKLSVKLQHVLEVAVERGTDTTAVQADVETFSTLVADAQKLHEQATTQFDTAAKLKGELRAAKVKEAHALLKQAQEKLKEAHKVLKTITNELREAKLNEELESPAAEASVTGAVESAVTE